MSAPIEICCLGELLIDFVATTAGQSLVDTNSFHKCAGGAPANVAVAAARLGAQSALVAKVGADPFGDFLIQTLRDEGITTASIVRDAKCRTTLAFVSIFEDGERDFIFFRNPGADTQLSVDDLPRDLISTAKVLHFGSLSLTQEPAREATLTAVQLARNAQVIISMDPNLRPILWPNPEQAKLEVLSVIPHVDLLKVSADEATFFSGLSDLEEAADYLRSLGPKLVLVTRGKDGASYHTDKFTGAVPSFPIAATDTTGAGDSFIAGWQTHWLKHAPTSSGLEDLDKAAIEAACYYAHAVAALTVQKPGAIPALPSSPEVDVFLEKQSM